MSYAWPLPLRLRGASAFMLNPQSLRARHDDTGTGGLGLALADQAALGRWEFVSLLGFSQGALAVPGVEDIAAHDGTRVGWTIIAYGGAPWARWWPPTRR